MEAKRVKKIFHGYPVNSYSFSRLFKNGMRIEIWSDFLALEHTMVLNKFLPRKNTTVFYPGIFTKRFFYLESHIDGMPVHDRIKYKNQLNSLKEIFDYTRPINIVEKGA